MSQLLVFTPVRHFSRLAFAMLFTASCSLTAAVQQSATTDHSLQVFKDCKLISERPLTQSELSAWQDFHKAELKMAQLQIPIDEMSKALQPHQDKISQLSAELEQQTKRDRIPDEALLEQTRMTADRIEDITDSYQGDIDAISHFGDEISKRAKKFEQQITVDLTPGSFDQLRIVAPGDSKTPDCHSGMFFSKSFPANKVTD